MTLLRKINAFIGRLVDSVIETKKSIAEQKIKNPF